MNAVVEIDSEGHEHFVHSWWELLLVPNRLQEHLMALREGRIHHPSGATLCELFMEHAALQEEQSKRLLQQKQQPQQALQSQQQQQQQHKQQQLQQAITDTHAHLLQATHTTCTTLQWTLVDLETHLTPTTQHSVACVMGWEQRWWVRRYIHGHVEWISNVETAARAGAGMCVIDEHVGFI
jgi:hypothetical protein